MSADNLHHVETAEHFDSLLAANTYVAVDFYADWCPPCKAIAPIYKSLADKHSAENTLAFAKVNVDNVQKIAARYNITAMPTFLFFKEGQQVAVNGQAMIQGADPRSLGAAAEKLGGLALKRLEEAKTAQTAAA
ncbi:thioredoxin-like protein [Trichoderma austrokoningii]